jgi:hypothetical protein
MIQRIQSIYLLLTTLLSTLFLKGSYLTFIDNSGYVIKLKLTGLLKYTGINDPEKLGEVWILFVLGILIPVLSIIEIFLFRNRRIQLLLNRILILLILAFLIASLGYSFIIIFHYEVELSSWYKMLVPVIQIVSAVLAYFGIKKDDELVKSFDRLR